MLVRQCPQHQRDTAGRSPLGTPPCRLDGVLTSFAIIAGGVGMIRRSQTLCLAICVVGAWLCGTSPSVPSHTARLAGAHLGTVGILALGVSNVVADALSMSVGEVLSSRSYNKYVQTEMEREAWYIAPARPQQPHRSRTAAAPQPHRLQGGCAPGSQGIG